MNTFEQQGVSLAIGPKVLLTTFTVTECNLTRTYFGLCKTWWRHSKCLECPLGAFTNARCEGQQFATLVSRCSCFRLWCCVLWHVSHRPKLVRVKLHLITSITVTLQEKTLGPTASETPCMLHYVTLISTINNLFCSTSTVLTNTFK